MAQTTSYQHFWDPGGSETVGDDLLHLPDAAVMLKVKAKVKKVKVKKILYAQNCVKHKNFE